MTLYSLNSEARQYLVVTGNYWAFTLTDGALRMLVVLHFYGLGYSPLDVAFLFLFYEFFGVVTNVIGGWLGARIGLNKTMNLGLGLQLIALGMLLVPPSSFSVGWVMASQALSGIAKDLNKMSAKSAIKALVPEDTDGKLFRWVALLTGSKNTLKGLGYFLGGALLAAVGFRSTIAIMLTALSLVFLASLLLLRANLGQASLKPKFKDIFSRSKAINKLAAARLFLFGARDIWFVIALPITLGTQFGWSHTMVGAFFAAWIIFYGLMQAVSPNLLKSIRAENVLSQALPISACLLLITTLGLTVYAGSQPGFEDGLVIGLLVFAGIFAMNSALHSYFVVAYAENSAVSMDVGFYYTANAAGRLLGTVLSGFLFQTFGLTACLAGASAMTLVAMMLTVGLPNPLKPSE